MVKYVQSGYIFAQSVANGVGGILPMKLWAMYVRCIFYLTDIARLYG